MRMGALINVCFRFLWYKINKVVCQTRMKEIINCTVKQTKTFDYLALKVIQINCFIYLRNLYLLGIYDLVITYMY